MIKRDHEILERALEAVNRETGRRLRMLKKNLIQPDGKVVDATIEVEGMQYHVGVKKWAQQANFGALIYQVKELPGNQLLVADYVNKKLAARLKEAGVQFIDTAGNAYIDQENMYLNIRGNDPVITLVVQEKRKPAVTVQIRKNQNVRPEQHRGTGRAFTPTGLKVVYELILEPELVRHPYRDIAERADVALGTVGWVLNDLKAQGVIVGRGKQKRIDEIGALVEAWAGAYPQKLREKQFIGWFFAEDPLWWKNFKLAETEALWGGEVAAALMTKYLKPQIATLYVRGDIGGVIQQGRLTKARRPEEANVEILRPFWKKDRDEETVHPVIVYADLIATADPRNAETAKLIYDKYFNQYHEQA